MWNVGQVSIQQRGGGQSCALIRERQPNARPQSLRGPSRSMSRNEMPTPVSVITPNRFEQGMTFSEFLDQATVNRDKFELYYRDSPVSDEDLAFFKKATGLPNGPAKILAIGADWCGDVYR